MRTRQEGFTVVELLVAVAISGVIASLMGTAIYQFFAVTGRGSDEMTAVHNIQNAAHWFSIDGQQASAATAGASLTLTIPSPANTVTYTLSGSEVIRTTVGLPPLTVARNITALSFILDGRVVTMTIKSEPAGGWGVSETKKYKVYLRPTG